MRSSVNYAAQSASKLFCHAYAPHGTRETNIEFVEHAVDIRDMRPSPDILRLDVEGACIVNHRSALDSFYDADDLHRSAYPETAELVRSVTGASEVVVFDHNLRRGGATAGRMRDSPLALCDASSVDSRDLHETDLLYPDRTGQIY